MRTFATLPLHVLPALLALMVAAGAGSGPARAQSGHWELDATQPAPAGGGQEPGMIGDLDAEVGQLVPRSTPTADPGGPYALYAADRIDGGWDVLFDGSGSSSDVNLVSWQWDLGADSLPGKQLNTFKWQTANTYQDDALYILGVGWGGSYAFTREPLQRRPGAAFQARVTRHSGNAAWGLKNTSASFHRGEMVYEMYFNDNNWIYIYENGSNRGYYQQYSAGVAYDVRIELKDTGGARYYFKTNGFQ